MSKKSSGKFDQSKYVHEWAKKHMGTIHGQYKKDFVDQFKTACKKLGVSQSEIFRKAMEETIKKAGE